MTDTEQPPAGIGDNNPPEPTRYVPDTLNVEVLVLELNDHNADLLTRLEALLEAAKRYDEKYTITDNLGRQITTIEDDEHLTRTGTFILQMSDCVKESEARRVAAKAPYLEGGGAVDGFFKSMIAQNLERLMARYGKAQDAYQNARANRLRREAEAAAAKRREEEQAAQRARLEAERMKRQAEEAARAAKNKAERVEAERQQAEAAKAEQAAAEQETAATLAAQAEEKTAAAPAAALTRTRGDMSMTTTATRWKFRVLDLAKVPVAYLTTNDAVINAAIKGEKGLREIPGLEIYSELSAQNRR